MSSNLFKETSAAARALDIELRGILEELDPEAGKPLLERLTVDAHPTPLLVFTGYHSAGKSTLIEALTNRAFNIPIGSGVTTAEVTEYVWDGDVRLVDTPGVHADRPEHDELAERALQAADLVLFAVPVELFDDILVDHLRDVLGRLAKARQTLIVITKAGTMDAAPGHREAAIKEALGRSSRFLGSSVMRSTILTALRWQKPLPKTQQPSSRHPAWTRSRLTSTVSRANKANLAH